MFNLSLGINDSLQRHHNPSDTEEELLDALNQPNRVSKYLHCALDNSCWADSHQRLIDELVEPLETKISIEEITYEQIKEICPLSDRGNNILTLLKLALLSDDINIINECLEEISKLSQLKISKTDNDGDWIVEVYDLSKIEFVIDFLNILSKVKIHLDLNINNNPSGTKDIPLFLKTFCKSIYKLDCNQIDGVDLREVSNLVNLQGLTIANCSNVIEFTSFENLIFLTTLAIFNTPFTQLPSLDTLKNLVHLELSSLNFSSSPNLNQLNNLKSLTLSGFKDEIPPQLNHLTDLETLILEDWAHAKTPPDLTSLQKLTTLSLVSWKEIAGLPYFGHLKNLEHLSIKDCKKVTSLTFAKAALQLLPFNTQLAKSISNIFNNSQSVLNDLIRTHSTPKLMPSFDEMHRILSLNVNEQEAQKLYFVLICLCLSESSLINKVLTPLIDPALTVETLSSWLQQDPETKCIIDKASQYPSLEWFILANFLKFPIEYHFESIFKSNPKGSDHFIGKDCKLQNTLSLFLKTEEGQQFIIENCSTIYHECTNLYNIVTKLYPAEDLNNGKFYPFIARVNDQQLLEIKCPSNQQTNVSLESLKKIADCMRNDNPLRIKVQYFGQKGVDAAGLTRDFLFKLFDKYSEELSLKKSVIEWTKENAPILEDLAQLLKISLYMSSKTYIIGANGDILLGPDQQPLIHLERYYLGNIFSPTYFSAMLEFDFSDISKDFSLVDPTNLFSVAFTIAYDEGCKNTQEYLASLLIALSWDRHSPNPDSQEGQKLISIMTNHYRNMELPLPIFSSDTGISELALYQRGIYTNIVEKFKEKIHTLHTLARFFIKEEHFTSFKNRKTLNGLTNGEALRHRIEGSFNKNKIKDSFHFVNVPGNIKLCIIQWIDKKTDKELRKFLAIINGSPIILPQGITIRQISEKSSVLACFGIIDVKIGITENQMIDLLEHILVDEGSFPNI